MRWQSNRRTANNIFGQVFPQSIIPAMSGPVPDIGVNKRLGAVRRGAVFVGTLRLQAAKTRRSSERKRRSRKPCGRSAGVDVQSAVGWHLGALTQRAVIATQADFDRREVLARTAHARRQPVRPGARHREPTRNVRQPNAPHSGAGDRDAGAGNDACLGHHWCDAIDGANLLNGLPATDVNAAEMPMHPLAQVHQAAVEATRSQEEVLARTDRPRLFVQSSVFARGSGANPDGQLDGGPGGLALERANWAAGVQLVFPTSSTSSLRARKARRRPRNGRRSRCDEARSRLPASSRRRRPWSRRRGPSPGTPRATDGRAASESQARARYRPAWRHSRGGAQSLLAGGSDQLARVEVWRALLAGRRRRTLASFLTLIHRLLSPLNLG